MSAHGDIGVNVNTEVTDDGYDDRAFPAAATRAWNALPSSVRTIPSLMSFCRELKSTLFNISFSGSDM